jgi:putative endonuclease
MKSHHYFLYITTNVNKSVLYIGVTNDLPYRLHQHREEALHKRKSFAGRYNCYLLIYFEYFQDIEQAIAREKQLKGWRRSKKEALIESLNPQWQFLNEEIKEDL